MVIRNADIAGSGYKSFYRAYSVYDAVSHKYVQQVFTVKGSDIYMPSSIGVDYVRRYFPEEAKEQSPMMSVDPKEASFSMVHPPRDAIQSSAMLFLNRISDDKIWQSRFLQLATGTGKTYCTIALACRLGLRSMIVVDTAELSVQWKSEFLKHTDMKESDIAILSGRDSVESERKLRSRKVYIAIHKTLGMLMDEDDNSVNKLSRDLGIGLRVFDEAHVDFHAICLINSFSNVRYTLYLTATPSRSNFREENLYGRVFGRIPYFNGRSIEDDKYHTVILTTFDSNPPIDVKGSIKTMRGFNVPKWASYISSDSGGYPNFEAAVFKIIDGFGLLNRGIKCALMLPTIELIDKMSASLKSKYGDGIDIGMFIGRIPIEDRKAELGHGFILTNDKIFDKAIDVEGLSLLIMAVPISSQVKTEQILGRLRHREGKPSILIDMADKGFPECVSQQKMRRRVYMKKAKAVRSATEEEGEPPGK
jgi:hypothetical protein